jgi:hypothetical protein
MSCSGAVVSGTVSLAANNPAPGTLVAGQATADLAHFTFGDSSVVTGVTLQRIGVSGDTTPSNVYLFDGATRLTDAASVTSTGLVTFTNPAGLFTGPKTISVKSDITTGTQGQTLGMKLVSYTVGGVVTTVNLSGNIHTIASATLATVGAGTVTPSGATINPSSAVTLWQSTLTVSNRDVLMKRLALRQVGSAPASAFQNFKLYVNGVQVATATGIDSMGYVTFDLSAAPATLVAGSRVVRVDADVVSGASRTVQLSLRQAADADFVDSSFGVNITPTSTPWTGSANTISGSQGGSLTVEKDITSPSTNLTLAGTDVNLGTFKLTAYGESIKIETLTAGGTFNGAPGSTNDAAVTLRNGRLLINGVQYGSTATLVPAGTSFTVNYTVVPGTPVLVEVHADVYDNDGTGALDASDTIIATLIQGSSNATRVDSLGSFDVPTASVSANTLTVATTAITLSKNGTYANQSTVLPATNFKMGSWNLTGSSTEDVLLTTLSFDVDAVHVSADDFTAADVTNMYVVVKNGSTVVAQPSPLGTVAAADNNYSVNYTLPKNSSVTVELFGNFGSTVTANEKIKTDLTITGTSLTSGQAVTATGADTDGQTITYGAASIAVSKDASSPVAAIAYDNQTLTTLVAKFDAVTASYNLTDLTVTLGANSDTVVQSVALYDGSTLVATAPMTTSTTAVFNGMAWNIPANTSKTLTVKVTLGSVGVGAGTTGSVITTSIAAATHAVYTNTSTGTSTSSTTEEGSSTATGTATYAYASVPTVSKVELSGSETDLLAGTKVLAKFSVASNGGTVAWKQVLLDITKSADPTIGSVELWDVTGGSSSVITAAYVFQNETTANSASTCDADDTDCELLITVGTNDDDNVEEQVSGTKTYEVRGTIGGSLSTGESVSTSIKSNLAHVSSVVFTSTDNDTTVDDATFVWSDISAQSHDTGTTDWVNENLVKSLPTSTWTMTYPL